jgi:hypothetical protein
MDQDTPDRPDLRESVNGCRHPLYQELAQGMAVRRFSFRDVELAQVGPFLLLAVNTAGYRDRAAAILVRQLPPVIAAIEDAAG